MCKILCCTILLTLCFVSRGFKVLLVFPYPSNANALLGEAYVKILANAGHEVTYLTAYTIKNAAKTVRQISVGNNIKLLPNDLKNITIVFDKNIDLDEVRTDLNIAFKLSNAVALNTNVQNLIQNPEEQFDAVIVDWMYSEIYSGFATVFNCPLIWATSMEPDASVLRLLNESLNIDKQTESLSFWQWATDQWQGFSWKLNKWSIINKEKALFNKAFGPAVAKRGRSLPPFESVKYSASLVLGYTHSTIDVLPGLPKNYIPIAGFNIDDKVALLKNMKTIMDNASDGVILFTLGSTLHGNSLPEILKTALLDVFENINKTVIWKYEDSLEASENIHVFSWIPQQAVLAHPNCKLMITSGGLLTINEAIHFNIPVIGIPMFKDQINNIERAVNKGFAKKVELNYKISSNLKAAIDEVLNNSKYKEKLQELSSIYRDRPIHPREEVVFWIEHVIRTKGARHLRSSVSLLSWYQKLYIELIIIALIVVGILGILFKFLLQRRRREGDFEFKKFI